MKPFDAAVLAGWRARLELGFEFDGVRTRLARRRHVGPLAVQRPFFPEGPGLCQALVLHPPGGVAGGDQLEVSIDVGAGAAAQLTTPGAGKWYRGFGREASQRVAIEVADGAVCEWLPQENIVFDGACPRMALEVALAAGAAYCGWELTCLGRPAGGHVYADGRLRQRMQVDRAGRALFREQALIEAGDLRLPSHAVLAGHCAYGTLVAVAATPLERERLDRARALASSQPHAGVTAFGDVVVGRWVGAAIEDGRRWFTALWALLRPWYAGRVAVAPRIWST